MYKLQMMGSTTMSAKEIQMLVHGTQFLPNKVVFTALNFFNLDYSMLCGVRMPESGKRTGNIDME